MGEVERYATSKNIDKRHREAPFCEVHRVVYEASWRSGGKKRKCGQLKRFRTTSRDYKDTMRRTNKVFYHKSPGQSSNATTSRQAEEGKNLRRGPTGTLTFYYLGLRGRP
ncbi:uncharacterized protein LOC100678558 isoform X1 [Nasonia vitripennis]|uniref:Uncharacterized protein n=1 Tax=Nasonia vitripennis TaxID=7425 RepID=A0A7M7T9S3_NASVI|nr:uncharacterized protein LOC100678558 isoform X1 [Nasonia vitripennis]XP_031785367.1 uncharacterized protein LOC100678558 isoform X1 [Nasonia vitripennis]